jgi:hypothetical protein
MKAKVKTISKVQSLILAGAMVTAADAAPQITEIIDVKGDGVHPLTYPYQVAVDGPENVVVTGSGNSNAFRITPLNVITRIISLQGDGMGNVLNATAGVAVDGAGLVYVTGSASSNAFRITTYGIAEIIDSLGAGPGKNLSSCRAVAVSPSGDVFVVGFESDNAFRITTGGVITQIIDLRGDWIHPLNAPRDIAIDGSGNAYVTGSLSDNVFKITPGGTITQIIDSTGDGTHPLDEPTGIAVDGSGVAFVSGLASDNVFAITSSGVITQIIDSGGDGTNPLGGPWDIAIGGSGSVFVTGLSSNNAFKIEPNGAISEIIDATGDGVGGLLQAPTGIAVNGSGEVFVVGAASHNAFKIDALPPPGAGYCFGDPGIGTPCPCGNNDGSIPGSGCDNGVFASGARLKGNGAASISADTLVLTTTHLEPKNTGLYFQADNDLSPGIVWGDGLQCAGGQLRRLQIRVSNVVGSSATTIGISAKAGNVLAGDTKRYQCWYRTVVNPPCGLGVNDFNASNGYAVTWQP